MKRRGYTKKSNRKVKSEGKVAQESDHSVDAPVEQKQQQQQQQQLPVSRVVSVEAFGEGNKSKLLMISSLAHRSTSTMKTNARACLKGSTSVKRTILNVTQLEEPLPATIMAVDVIADNHVCRPDGKFILIKRGDHYSILGLPDKLMQAYFDALPRSECLKIIDEVMGKPNTTGFLWLTKKTKTVRAPWSPALREVIADALTRTSWIIRPKTYYCTHVGMARISPVMSGKYKTDISSDVTRCFLLDLPNSPVWFDEDLFLNKDEFPHISTEEKLDRVPLREQLSQMGFDIQSRSKHIDAICPKDNRSVKVLKEFSGTVGLVRQYFSGKAPDDTAILSRGRTIARKEAMKREVSGKEKDEKANQQCKQKQKQKQKNAQAQGEPQELKERKEDKKDEKSTKEQHCDSSEKNESTVSKEDGETVEGAATEEDNNDNNDNNEIDYLEEIKIVDDAPVTPQASSPTEYSLSRDFIMSNELMIVTKNETSIYKKRGRTPASLVAVINKNQKRSSGNGSSHKTKMSRPHVGEPNPKKRALSGNSNSGDSVYTSATAAVKKEDNNVKSLPCGHLDGYNYPCEGEDDDESDESDNYCSDDSDDEDEESDSGSDSDDTTSGVCSTVPPPPPLRMNDDFLQVVPGYDFPEGGSLFEEGNHKLLSLDLEHSSVPDDPSYDSYNQCKRGYSPSVILSSNEDSDGHDYDSHDIFNTTDYYEFSKSYPLLTAQGCGPSYAFTDRANNRFSGVNERGYVSSLVDPRSMQTDMNSVYHGTQAPASVKEGHDDDGTKENKENNEGCGNSNNVIKSGSSENSETTTTAVTTAFSGEPSLLYTCGSDSLGFIDDDEYIY